MTDLATRDEAVLALIQEQDEEIATDTARFQTPILKLCQGLTEEVKRGDAEPGDFLYTLTGESFGTSVEFVVASYVKGRSHSERGGRYFVARGTDTIPESWSEYVGPEFVGTRFDEHPDAEEQYRDRVNRGDIKWESGPPISTTYNYTGLVLSPTIEGDDEAEPLWLPVLLTFQRTTRSAHDKLSTMKKSLMRNKGYWEHSFIFDTEEKAFGKNSSFVVNVKKGRPTPPEVQSQAIELAMAVKGGNVTANEAAAVEKTVEPDAKGGLGL